MAKSGSPVIGFIPLEVRDRIMDISELECIADSGFATAEI